MGMNTVSIDPQFIESEFQRIRTTYDATQTEAQKRELQLQEQGEQGAGQGGELSVNVMPAHEKREILSKWISKGLSMVFNGIFKLQLDPNVFREFSEATADMLEKYNANLSAFEIIERYKVELAFGWSAIMLTSAIVQGFSEKARQKKALEKGVTIDGGEDHAATA